MNRFLFFLSVLLLFALPAWAAPVPVQKRQPTQAVQDDPLLSMLTYNDGSTAFPGIISNKKVPLSDKEKKALSQAKAFQDRPVQPFMSENGRITYIYGQSLPSVVCAPMMACDVELAPGEQVNDVVLGDTARWKVVMARSGTSAESEKTHIVFKPVDAGLETMAVVTTDRRTYHLKLLSQAKGHMPYVGFVYPEETESSLRSQLQANQERQQQRSRQDTLTKAQQPAGNPAKLDFGYEIQGKAPWKPEQVYSDGRQTFIRLPANSAHTEIPVLLVRRQGDDVMVNYRVKDGAMVVDEQFNEAVLIAGVGKSQERVTIKRKDRTQ